MKIVERIKALAALLCVFLFILCCALPALPARSEEAGAQEASEMRVITAECTITLNGKTISGKLTDDEEQTYLEYETAVIEISAPCAIGGIYLKFDRTPPLWTLSFGEQTVGCGANGFLHEYAAIPEGGQTTLRLNFARTVVLADLFVLSEGSAPPAFVQVWRPASGRADIVMFPAHSDDDQLFFAGSAPDAAARGAEMQVCYFTNHWKSHKRPHELLNGLWTCGITRYPVIGELPDLHSLSIEEGLEKWEAEGFDYDKIVEMQVALLRRFKPQIVLGHDEEGEYGHGAHRIDSLSLRDAVIAAGDATKYPASADAYGVWNVPKTYIHLWKENTIDFEIDVPLARFGGKTAYQVSQDAFRCHVSQMSTRYTGWLLGTEEEPVTSADRFHGDGTFGPRSYGLWRSTVGRDVEKKDFYENIVLYRQQELDARRTLDDLGKDERAQIDFALKTPQQGMAEQSAALDRSMRLFTIVSIVFGALSVLIVILLVVFSILLAKALKKRK